MKFSSIFLIAVTLLAVTARGDLTLVQKIEGAGSNNELTIKVKGDKARVEISPALTTIIDGKSGDMINLMNKEKKIIRLSAEKTKAIAELANKYSKDPANSINKGKLVATGKKETINGYETEEYVRESGSMKERYWIAPNYPDAAAIIKQLQAIRPTAWNDVAKGMLNFQDFPGLPLRTIVKSDKGELTCTMVSIKQDPLSDAEFAAPKDYEEMKMPNLQDFLSEKGSNPSKKP